MMLPGVILFRWLQKMDKILKVCKKHGPLYKKQVYEYWGTNGRKYYYCSFCQLKYKKKYAKQYAEMISERHKKWYRKNKQKHLKARTDWHRKNTSRRAEYNHAYLILKKGNPELMRLYKKKYSKKIELPLDKL